MIEKGIWMQLDINNIVKVYGKKRALDDYNISFVEGIYGFLGPNGAGKSTLMKIITGNVKPTSGNILLNGNDIYGLKADYRKLIGYMPQQQVIYPFYSGRQFLNYMGILKGENKKTLNQKIDFLADKVNLLDVIDEKIGTYSGGMKQRLLIAQTFLGDSKILVFDEPTAGLDPKERIHVRNLIHDNSEGKVIIIATHVVQDIEDIASCIVLQKNGRVIKMGSPKELVGEFEGANDLEDVYMKVFQDKKDK